MKFRQIIFLLLSILFVKNIFPVIEGLGVGLRKIKKEDYEKALPEKSIGTILNSALEIELDGVRYICVQDFDVAFDKFAFYSANYFYLGAKVALGATPINESALMRFDVRFDSVSQRNVVGSLQMAPEFVILNSKTNKVQSRNPIYNNRITNLTLMHSLPVVTLGNATPIDIDGVAFNENQLVCLVEDTNAGGSVKTNTQELKDAAGGESRGVVGMAASSNNIFAAVKSSSSDDFGGDNNSGFANISRSQDSLTQKENATRLNLLANQLLAINQDAKISGLGDMYYDSILNRVFIGLVGVERNQSANAGGAISVLVGRLDNDELKILSVFNLDQNLFDANDASFVGGFYYTINLGVGANSYKVRTMHTSTGNSYLIVNGGVVINGEIKNKFYALPLIKEENATTGVTTQDIGKVANKNDFTRLPQNPSEMSKRDQDPVIIGGGVDLNLNTQDVEDMFVVGDSVYVCLAGNRANANRESGIFRSTAIFAADGKIRCWTPWQRVMGNFSKTYGAGIDTATGNFWYFTEDATGIKNKVAVTQWGVSEQIDYLLGNGLVSIINSEFEQSDAGVHQIFNFDEKTPSLSRNNAANELSIMVATGNEKIALIKTGAGSPFTQTQEFIKDPADPNRNVFIWDNDDALKSIGPICCSDVSRLPLDTFGYLFVGGFGGLGVLRNGNGRGWNGDPAAAQSVDLVTISGWGFKELKKANNSSFLQTRKIVGDGRGYLLLLTAENIYRISINYDKFKDANPVALDEKIIAKPSGTLLDMIIFYRGGIGINGTRLLVATTSGLFYSDEIDENDENKTPTWNRLQLASGQDFNTPVSHMSFVSYQKGGYTTNGNLYVDSSDLVYNLSNMYRFDVGFNNVTNLPYINPITEFSGTDYFYSMGELRPNFLTDGSFGFNMSSKHLGKTDFLRKLNISSNQSAMRNTDSNIDLYLDNNAYNIGVIAQNTASGAWVVPGDWGIRVND